MTRVIAVVAVAALLLSGCMTWRPGWENQPIRSPELTDGGPPLSRAAADAAFAEAREATAIRQAIAGYKAALEDSPDDADLLTDLADAHILYGAAWARSTREKAVWYRAGIRYAERSMATNESFRARVEGGAGIGDAATELGPHQVRTMLLWVTGVSYYFKECLGVRQLLHFRWMLRTREMMEHMLAVDPEFGGGAVLFSLGIYHLALPPGAGRDLKRSREFLDRAVAVSPTSLLTRWGRAKYFHVMTGDREAFRRDLEWVIAQSPETPDNTLAWNLYFQRDARETLGRIDRLF
jgi:hypothetical protein